MDKYDVMKIIMDERYYPIKDLRFNRKLGIMFSKEQLSEFLAIKDELVEDTSDIEKECDLDDKIDFIMKLPLKTFNSRHCFYVDSKYLLSTHIEYMQIHMDDIDLHQNTLFNRNLEDMLKSRLFSEVEGSLRIENVPTTHKRIVEISKQESLTDKNDIIIKNMLNAMEFIIVEKPAFNKDNLKKLYQILCNNCLADDLCLKEDAYYRDDAVYIDKYEGADWHIVEECMDSMFAFANNEDNIKKHGVFLPYICHYYILYVHPYFDYNGRIARMVSFWLNYINDIPVAPYFISEAINESKGDYYSALANTRDTNNDLTYFLGYILETSIRYSFVYKNLEEIRKELSKAGDSLSSGEWVYVKKILIHNTENYFNYKEFLGYINATMTRQGALKILNNLTEYGILEKTKNRKGDTIFRLNPDCVTYQYHS